MTLFEGTQRISILDLRMSVLLWAGAFSDTWNDAEPALRNFIISDVEFSWSERASITPSTEITTRALLALAENSEHEEV
jgi:hypothetical protein